MNKIKKKKNKIHNSPENRISKYSVEYTLKFSVQYLNNNKWIIFA